jgi:hypothetical protein
MAAKADLILTQIDIVRDKIAATLNFTPVWHQHFPPMSIALD